MTLKYGQMLLSVETVTPAIAKRWLDHSNLNNRRLRLPTVNQYADDMINWVWHKKPVAICFDVGGMLGNGQHTLHAIIKSGIPQELLIARNVPSEAIAAMDVGLKRTIADIAHFLGEELGSRQAAIARLLKWGPASTDTRSFSATLDAYIEHDEPIDWVCKMCPRASGFSAAVLAVIVRAWYSRDRKRIAEFIEVMKTGVASGNEDVAAIRLRDFCRSLKSSGGRAMVIETYQRTQSALDYFLRRKPITKLYGTDKELFSLPKVSE